MGDRKRQRQLLGYLLGALDDRQRRRIDEQLMNNPDLEAELARVQESLYPLQTLSRVHEPPAGLAARTCSRVFAYADALARRKSDARATRRAPQRARTMSPEAVPPTSTATWGWSDLFVAVSVFLAVAGLIFPAIQSSRMNMRLVACQNNLRQVGATHAQFQQTRPLEFADASFSAPVAPMRVSYATFVDTRERVDPRPQPADSAPASMPRVLPIVSVGLGRNMVSPHQGFSQAVHGQNLLFHDGHAGFLAMAPIDLSSDSATSDDAVAPWPADGVNPIVGSNPLPPIVLVSGPAR